MIDDTPPFREPAPACPRCGRIFEVGFRTDDGRQFKGHVPGDPKTCVPFGPLVTRDARERKWNRR